MPVPTRAFPGLLRPMPVCGLGGWALGGRSYGAVDPAVARATVIRFLELGGRFIDTAEAYGVSEEIIGDVVAGLGCRDRVVLATKTPHHSPHEIRGALEQSLRRLRTDRIDIYQIHRPPDDTEAMNAVCAVFADLQATGRVGLVGASVRGPAVTAATTELCRRYIVNGQVQALQVIYSALRPRNEAMFAQAAASSVGLIARTALESGFLAGTYAPGQVFPPGDHRHRWSRERLDRILQAVQRLATALPPGIDAVAELAIRFALSAPQVSVVVLGAKSPQQVERNWRAAAKGSLDEAELAQVRRCFEGLAELGNPD